MAKEVMVDMGKYEISTDSSILVCLGLGSCIGVAIYDEKKKIAGLAHIMLAHYDTTRGSSPEFNGNKYANIALPAMISDLEKKGCNKCDMKSKIAGGAQMFSSLDDKHVLDIGTKNAESITKVLSENGIRLVSKDIGGNIGRTVRFDVSNCKMIIRTKSEIKEI